MADKLVVFQDNENDCFRIIWCLDDNVYGDDYGLSIGEDVTTPAEQKEMMELDPFDKKLEDRDHILYTQAALELLEGVDIDLRGFVFDTRKQATEAMRTIKVAAKVRRSNRQLPEWAKIALSQGWKMPKGWEP